MFRIAHISDLHIPPLPRVPMRQLAGKRLLGLFSWHQKWKSEHRQTILDALLAHLKNIEPDHICVTGDITFTTLPAEVDMAADWISRLGDPQRISLIPGNHDAYVPGALDYALAKWSRWMRDDEGQPGFPYLHRRGPVNIVGLSSAVTTPPAVSSGRIGQTQLEKTEALLTRIKADQRPCLLLIHHPPQDGATSRRRALSDRKKLQEVLARSPVDLVLHGHLHYPTRATLDCPSGPIPVLGAASASTIGNRKSTAHYHVIEMEMGGRQPRMTVQHYHYNTVAGNFSHSGTQAL
jgi:3',5'-cyclic AMP phosphodiesterase CpdA